MDDKTIGGMTSIDGDQVCTGVLDPALSALVIDKAAAMTLRHQQAPLIS